MPKKEIILKATSSNKFDFYNVTFINENGLIKIKCDCRAGIFSWVCRHKLALLRNDDTILFDNFQKDLLNKVALWINKSSYPKLIIEYDKIESNYNAIKKELKTITDQIEEKRLSIYNYEAANIDDKDNKMDSHGNVLRYDLLKIFLHGLKNRDQKYYDEIDPYSNPKYLKLEKALVKIETEFKHIKKTMKSAMQKGA